MTECKHLNKGLRGEIWPDETTCISVLQCLDCKDVFIHYDHTRRQKNWSREEKEQ